MPAKAWMKKRLNRKQNKLQGKAQIHQIEIIQNSSRSIQS